MKETHKTQHRPFVQLKQIHVRPIVKSEIRRYNDLMQAHHYLGALNPIGETLRYIALWQNQWLALITFSSAALKCSVRDQWIGWRYRYQFDRNHLLTNNSRFLILPQYHYPNMATRILSLCQRRLPTDWAARFKHPLLLLETFVDPSQFQGTIYKAANWHKLGLTQGFSRTREGYRANGSRKLVFVYPLQRNARRLLSEAHLKLDYQFGEPKLMISAAQMKTLPELFNDIEDPRRAQGRRHRLSTILAIATAAVLCGRVGYKGIAQWAQSLGPAARERFRCRYKDSTYIVPSEFVIRDTLIRVAPEALDQALRQWSTLYATEDESLAIDGKTMRSAIDGEGKQTHIMSAIGHQSLCCYTQKKSDSFT
ncbi:MAG: DUF4338 domain-containing protein [Gammaproteobacteria bacterium]|nr:DUF4338 domain-containing protein [Gammaproteobacteria bacterium]